MDIIFFSPFNEIKTRGGEFGSKESQEFWVGCDFFLQLTTGKERLRSCSGRKEPRGIR